jgi:hypothetical protein
MVLSWDMVRNLEDRCLVPVVAFRKFCEGPVSSQGIQQMISNGLRQLLRTIPPSEKDPAPLMWKTMMDGILLWCQSITGCVCGASLQCSMRSSP